MQLQGLILLNIWETAKVEYKDNNNVSTVIKNKDYNNTTAVVENKYSKKTNNWRILSTLNKSIIFANYPFIYILSSDYIYSVIKIIIK